jgi:hypothetical protein
MLIGLVALSMLGTAQVLPADEKAAGTAENQDARETKLVMLKLPAMV